MTHDFAAQQAETRDSFAALQQDNDLGDVADVDYFFLPAAAARWDACIEALTDAGFACTRYDGGDSNDATDTPTLQATLHDQILTAQGIWLGEEVATRIAIAHGFTPDGWGLLA